MIEKGWTPVNVRRAPQYVHSMKKACLKAKRLQYGLRHHIANTIHGVMGATLCKVATEINKSSSDHQLWEKGQLVVLISPTNSLSDITFVGDKEQTLKMLLQLLLSSTQYDEFVEHILDVLSLQRGLPLKKNVNLSHHYLRPNDIMLPADGSGAVYILISVKDIKTTYIGMTEQPLAHRLAQHNSGLGAITTSDPKKRPWAYLGFVVGFDNNRDALRDFEQKWKQRRDHLASNNHSELGVEAIVDIGVDMTSWTEYSYYNLGMIRTCDLCEIHLSLLSLSQPNLFHNSCPLPFHPTIS